MTTVLDASVVAKWLLPEQDSNKAAAVLSAWNKGALTPLAPDLLSGEIANTLWKTAARGLIENGDATRLFMRFEALRLPLVPAVDLARQALHFALSLKHPVYDCIYASLALREHCELLTADEKLFRAFRPMPVAVRLLKDWGARA